MNPYRIGILGGMGPLAGVELHRLIIHATPAASDQEHLQVVLYTDPSIPDRTTSLAEDDGNRYVDGLVKAARVLEQANPSVIAIACMTAHSRLRRIQDKLDTPILSGIELVHRELTARAGETIAILATDGSIKAGVYTTSAPASSHLVFPTPSQQCSLMNIIYDVKRNGPTRKANLLTGLMDQVQSSTEASSFILGCTELGLFYDDLIEAGYSVIDPMRLLARELVARSNS